MRMKVDCPKRESGDERRLAIAKAARALIVEKGLEGLRTRDIAARVGINIATLHYHVPSKEALVTLVAQSLKQEFRDQGNSRPRGGKTGRQLLRMEIEDVIESMIEAPDRLSIMAELIERSRRDPSIADIIRPMTGYWKVMLADVFALGARDGTLRPDLDPEAAAQIFLGTVASWRAAEPSRAEIEAVFSEFERAFIAPVSKGD
jgi:AcrR family transcriptional regulator